MAHRMYPVRFKNETVDLIIEGLDVAKKIGIQFPDYYEISQRIEQAVPDFLGGCQWCLGRDALAADVADWDELESAASAAGLKLTGIQGQAARLGFP